MSTLADELLQDFEDSGSGEEDVQVPEFATDGEPDGRPVVNGHDRRKRQRTDHDGNDNGMELDGDEEAEDEEMGDVTNADSNALEDGDNEEEAKAKVEKMQLGGVNDVRSVAGLMKTLEPVLEVSKPLLYSYLHSRVYTFTSIVLES